MQKALCNDDMFVLCHHSVIHSAQLEGKTAVWLSVNTHGCPIIVYEGRCGKAVTVWQQRNYAGLTGYDRIEERQIFKMQQD